MAVDLLKVALSRATGREFSNNNEMLFAKQSRQQIAKARWRLYIAMPLTLLSYEEHIPCPTVKVRAMLVYDFRPILKLIAILVCPLRFFVVKVYRSQAKRG